MKIQNGGWRMENGGWQAACAIFYLLSSIFAHAELTATVYPGYTLSANERPTTAILNLLARPTVTVSGTLGGTNVGLAANSVSGAMLMTSVVDDDTIEFFDNGGVTAMRVKAYNIGTNVIGANIAGLGLGGGDGFALSNKTDNATLTITNDVLTLMSNLSPVYVTWVTNTVLGASTYGTNAQLTVSSGFDLQTNTLALRQWTSAEYALGTGGNIMTATNHGFGSVPTYVRAVLVCKTTDLGYAVGTELGLDGIYNDSGGSPIPVAVTSTTIAAYATTGGFNSYVTINTSGALATITTTSWRLKVYARP